MKKLAIYTFVFGLTMGLYGCHKFLHEYPKDQVYATSVQDLNELLSGEGYMKATSGTDLGEWIHLMDDDVLFNVNSAGRPLLSDFYWWKPDVNTQTTWKNLYMRIAILNVVLDEAENFKGETDYHRVRGEALFLRAVYYYWLTNIYGKPYSAATSTQDLGVPLKLVPEVVDKKYARNTLQECYDRITMDLREAIFALKDVKQSSVYRVNQIGARLLLSRVYNYMGHWSESVAQCDTIFQSNAYSLLDYNSLTSLAKANVISAKSPETIFSTGAYTFRQGSTFLPYVSNHFKASSEILEKYDPNDIRRNYFFRGYSTAAPGKMINVNDGSVSGIFLLRLPEAYLNRAEALCALEQYDKAIDDVQTLRRARFKSQTVEPLTLTGETLMNFIRDERRREFTFEAQRWFDLRRYAVSPKWPYQKEISHAYYTLNVRDGSLVLKPYDKDKAFYVLPIPDSEIVFNSGVMLQNEPRTEKSIVY